MKRSALLELWPVTSPLDSNPTTNVSFRDYSSYIDLKCLSFELLETHVRLSVHNSNGSFKQTYTQRPCILRMLSDFSSSFCALCCNVHPFLTIFRINLQLTYPPSTTFCLHHRLLLLAIARNTPTDVDSSILLS